MRKLIIGIFCFALCMGVTTTVSAQLPSGMLGKAVGKAAKKMADKATEKAVDELEKEAEKRLGLDQPTENRRTVEDETNPEENTYRQGRVNVTEGGVYASIRDVMAAIPALPTAKELTTYKDAELNGGGLRLVTSPVTKFNMEVASLSMQAMQFAYSDADSAKLMAQAYQAIENTTGLTKADIEKMEGMSDAEQEAYLRSRNVAAKAEAAQVKQAYDAAKYLEPIQPKIEQWTAVNDKIDAVYEKLQATQKAAYQKYAAELKSTTGRARNAVLVKYYGEYVEAQRAAVQQVLQMRLKEQMPIAEEIESYIKGVREQNPDYINSLLNYPQLTQVSYFSEVAHLLELPEFND